MATNEQMLQLLEEVRRIVDEGVCNGMIVYIFGAGSGESDKAAIAGIIDLERLYNISEEMLDFVENKGVELESHDGTMQ